MSPCLANLTEGGVPDTTARAISGHKADAAQRRYVIMQNTAKVAAFTAMIEAVTPGDPMIVNHGHSRACERCVSPITTRLL